MSLLSIKSFLHQVFIKQSNDDRPNDNDTIMKTFIPNNSKFFIFVSINSGKSTFCKHLQYLTNPNNDINFKKERKFILDKLITNAIIIISIKDEINDYFNVYNKKLNINKEFENILENNFLINDFFNYNFLLQLKEFYFKNFEILKNDLLHCKISRKFTQFTVSSLNGNYNNKNLNNNLNNKKQFKIIDFSCGRNRERKQWLKKIVNVNYIIYTGSLIDCYKNYGDVNNKNDDIIDDNLNRLLESLQFFEYLLKSLISKNQQIIVIFTHVDKFIQFIERNVTFYENKKRNCPLNFIFKEFDENQENNPIEIFQFILQKFKDIYFKYQTLKKDSNNNNEMKYHVINSLDENEVRACWDYIVEGKNRFINSLLFTTIIIIKRNKIVYKII
ncbi:hypothetical protein ABK040_011224 [Willaertia magna]